MAKFKVGDKVAFKGNKSYKGVAQKVQPLFGHETIYTIKWNDGKQYDVTEGDLVIANSVRSTNSVVRKALNSKVVKNASLRKIYSIVKQATQSDTTKAQQMAKSVLAQVKTAVVDLKKVEQSLSVAATSKDNDAIADALIDAYDTIEGMIY